MPKSCKRSKTNYEEEESTTDEEEDEEEIITGDLCGPYSPTEGRQNFDYVFRIVPSLKSEKLCK